MLLDMVLNVKTKVVVVIGLVCCLLFLSACEAAAVVVVPTDPPTETATFTPSPTRTPGNNTTPTLRPTLVAANATSGPSPTPLFGATRTPLPNEIATVTRVFNPNAPRIEFFTSDQLTVEPGAIVTLFWSARNVDTALIYRLDEDGERTQVYNNLPPDGSLQVDTRSSERGQLEFILAVGEEATYQEIPLTLPLSCPVEWFFSPSPEACPDEAPLATRLVDQSMQRGRMVFVAETDTIYALFNDGTQPAWSSFDNRYDPTVHEDRDPNIPPDFIQPLRELGFLWRTQSTVRNRLGRGAADAIEYEGFVQATTLRGGQTINYVMGANGVVLVIFPGTDEWQIIGAPQ